MNIDINIKINIDINININIYINVYINININIIINININIQSILKNNKYSSWYLIKNMYNNKFANGTKQWPMIVDDGNLAQQRILSRMFFCDEQSCDVSIITNDLNKMFDVVKCIRCKRCLQLLCTHHRKNQYINIKNTLLCAICFSG